MPNCSPQRYVGNQGNVLRTAALTPSSVLPVEDQVIEIPAARLGTGGVALTGPYNGQEAATYDVEIVDNDVEDPVVSAVVAAGVGSGVISGVVAQGPAQQYIVELQNDGVPTLAAGVDFEGVRIVARTLGTSGNLLSLRIDQSGLTFTPQAFSLLDDLPVGAGGPNNGLQGAAFDWDTKVLSADNIIPADAHRVSFGDDRTNIYLAYKQYVSGEWQYHFVPALKRGVAKGTIVNFVTGGRTVYVENGDSPPPESFAGIITVYDLLNAIKTTSVLLNVSGVVAYDRSPTGQASKELLLRTDAHCEPSTGSGSKFATGFVDTFANANAATELVTAECFAVTSTDNPIARVGKELWHLKGSVSGELGDIVTGVPFTDPGGKFGLTIPVKVPPNISQPTGRFTLVATNYVSREEVKKPPICVVAMALGPEAVDQTVTLRWTQRPNGDCACNNMPIPKLSKRCLGLDTQGDDLVGLQADTLTKLLALWDYAQAVARDNSTTQVTSGFGGSTDVAVISPFVDHPGALSSVIDSAGLAGGTPNTILTIVVPDSFLQIIASFESALVELDPIGDATLRAAGETAWDTAFGELQTDVPTGSPLGLVGLDSNIYSTRLHWVLASAGIPSAGGGDASVVESGDGCWRDMGGDFWTVVGSVRGAYAPAFNGAPYYSSRLATDGKKYFSTKEYGFQINIKCPELLEYGDEIVLSIGDSGVGATYTIGDLLVLPVIAGQNLQLAGGQNGSRLLNFYVTGSVSGSFPNFAYDPDAPAEYYEAGELRFTFTPGGIPNRKGDRWTWATEGGHYRWRKDGGVWHEDSPLPVISTVPAAFDSGLLIAFIPGAAPSFEIGDRYSFRALQPWAVSNVRTPTSSKWRWDEATPSLIVDTGASVPVPGAVIARHTIPQGATITLEGGDAPGVYLWSEALTWNEDVIAKEFATARTARYLRLSLTAATDGGIGWAWAGVMLSTSLSADVDIGDSYKIETSTVGLDEGGKYFAQGASGDVKFSDEALSEADAAGLRAWIKWAKRNNDEPCVVIPNVERPDEAYLVQVAVNELLWKEGSGNNATPGVRDRRYTIDIPLTGVWRA